MIGTMYQSHALPKAYGASYSKGRGSGSGVTQVALVVLLVLAGGLGLMQMSSRSQVRDLKIHHEALQEELTYTKNHLHHVEAQLASKEAEYTHLAQEVHQYSAHHSIQELETLRTQKRVSDQSLATAQDEAKKYKEELEAAHALIDAYKHHLSDEVASHHQREETWMAVQTEWEKLEQELNAEIDSLRNQLNAAHIKINEASHPTHAHPQHLQAEAQRHDPLLDNLPPATTQPQQQQQPTAGTPAPAAAVPTPVPTPAPVHAAPVPVHTPATPVHHQDVHHQDPHAVHQQAAPVPVPTVPAPAQGTAPPHPAEAPHAHHNDHYQHHDQGTHHEWKPTDYDQGWDAHNLYADYPGFVDEHHDAAHNTWEHHGDNQHLHADNGHLYDHSAHPSPHAQHHAQQQQQQVPLPTGTPAAYDPHSHVDPGAHAQQQHQQTHQAGTAHPAATQQHGHVDPHAQHQQQQHQQAQHTDAQAHQQHHVVDDLAMKLGLGGHYEDHIPEQQWHH